MGSRTTEQLGRVLFALILLGLLFAAPAWILFVTAVFGGFLFHPARELLCVGLALDLLYGLSDGWRGIPLPYTILSLIFFFILQYAVGYVRIRRQ